MTSPTARSILLAVLGWPVSHSLSPAMHNAAFRAAGLDACYVACAVPPSSLPAAVAGLHALGFHGANVTVPHKEAVLALASEADAAARAIGAANVLARTEAGFRAHNTDAPGFLRALAGAGFQVEGARVLVLGAGGAARAVVYAVASAGAASVVVANRTTERALRLVDHFRTLGQAELAAVGLEPESLSPWLRRATLIVNATSVGLPGTGPCPDATPPVAAGAAPALTRPAAGDNSLPPWETIFAEAQPDALAVDLVYHPSETGFLAAARGAGLATLGGLPMLVHQAALSWNHWFGWPGPADVMLQAALAGLARDTGGAGGEAS